MFQSPLLTPSIEDSLRVIHDELKICSPVSTSRIAKRLHIADASVTAMFQRLSDAGLVHYARYKGVVLTEHGRACAEALLTRNELVQRFLASALAFSGDELSTETDAIEHAVSPELLARFTAYLEKHEATIGEPA